MSNWMYENIFLILLFKHDLFHTLIDRSLVIVILKAVKMSRKLLFVEHNLHNSDGPQIKIII